MLNKLLKRCMPWMDKGRWYHFNVTTDQDNNISVKHDNVFSRYTVVDGTNRFVHLYFAGTEVKKSIIDSKVIARSLSGQYVTNGPYIFFDLVEDDGYCIEFQVVPSMLYDCWIFMR